MHNLFKAFKVLTCLKLLRYNFTQRISSEKSSFVFTLRQGEKLATMNSTKIDVLHFSTAVPWMILFISEALLIITANSVTIFIFLKIRTTLKRTNYLLINLAVADVCVGLGLSFHLSVGIARILGEDISYVWYWKLNVDFVALMASLLSLALISLERMFAIVWPIRHRLLDTRYYFVSIGFVWLLAIVVTALNETLSINDVFPTLELPLVTIVMALLVLLIIIVAYITIWITIKRNRTRLISATRSMVQNKKLARTLFIVTAVSVLTWFPSHIVIMAADYPGSLHSNHVQFAFALLFSNSFLNPIVYCFRMTEFKNYFKRVLCRCTQGRQSIDHSPVQTQQRKLDEQH